MEYPSRCKNELLFTLFELPAILLEPVGIVCVEQNVSSLWSLAICYSGKCEKGQIFVDLCSYKVYLREKSPELCFSTIIC